MASKINADEFVDREGEDKPTLPKGVVLSGVTTITTAVVAGNEVANSTGINAGIITSTHFAGNLTGDVNAGIVTVTSQTVVGSAVTISASGIDIGAGVITATSYAGGGANLTGVGATIMVWEYNPDPSDMMVPFDTGIGITFNQKIKAGSGNITLREDSASGTVVENFGIGSSVTIAGNELSFTPTSNLSETKNYYLSYPSGVITNMAGESYVGTAYTFKAITYTYEAWVWGQSTDGQLGLNNTATRYSSPVQLPGSWQKAQAGHGRSFFVKSDGTLWGVGFNDHGCLGQNNAHPAGYVSSPIQVGSDTTWSTSGRTLVSSFNYANTAAIKTDGTLWMWGKNIGGALGQNNVVHYSSPVQIPGTTWSTISGHSTYVATKTDGTMWSWGYNVRGLLAQNTAYPGTARSSPVQIPGTTWSDAFVDSYHWAQALKTDGTLWAWGFNTHGQLGVPSIGTGDRSSPVQVAGTTWRSIPNNHAATSVAQAYATKTDGTLWSWGYSGVGELGQNTNAAAKYSSPIQVAGTNWSSVISSGYNSANIIKTDGTLWNWGQSNYGQGGHNNRTTYSSPKQIPGTTWHDITSGNYHRIAIKRT